jgi:hypothetical protein
VAYQVIRVWRFATRSAPRQPDTGYKRQKLTCRVQGRGGRDRCSLNPVADRLATGAARRSMKQQKSDDTGDNGERVYWMLPPQRVSVPHPPSIYRFERLPGTGRALPLREPSGRAILNLE